MTAATVKEGRGNGKAPPIEVTAPLTPKADKTPAKGVLRVFWKTRRQWNKLYIADFQSQVPSLVEQIASEQYFDKNGAILQTHLTCEDFAVRVLVQYAQDKGLPVKLTTGVRAYSNIEVAGQPEHANCDASYYGFCNMVMVSYGAPDMQRTGVNTVAVASPADLKPGDILALAHDTKGAATNGRAHHIQVVVKNTGTSIQIFQGNSGGGIHKPISWLYRMVRKNAADPQDSSYAGKLIETGTFTLMTDKTWSYENHKTKSKETDFLKYFDLLRWNFLGFNDE